MIWIIYLYAAVTVVAAIGIMANKADGDGEMLSYSIAVVARNEEEALPFLLLSFSQLNYPEELYEIILVDDDSSDNTYNLMSAIAKAHRNIKIIKIIDKQLPGKKAGLQAALEIASKEIFVLTDADCVVRPDWLKSYNSFWKKEIDLIVGYAPELTTGDHCNFRRFIGLVSAGIYAATIGLKIPFSCAGRNLAVRRKALLAVDGYKSLSDFAAGDDKQMLNLIVSNGGRVKYNPCNTVQTQPETEAFHEQQKRRYGKMKHSSPLHLVASLLLVVFYLYLPVHIMVMRDWLGLLIYYLSSLFIWVVNLAKHREPFCLSDLIYILIYPYYFIYYSVLGSFSKWRWR